MITLNERIRLILIDWMISIFILFMLLLPFIISDALAQKDDILGEVYVNSKRSSVPYGIYNFFVFSIFLNKDAFGGRSVSKRLSGFQIVGTHSNKASPPLRCLLRNSTILIWPLELVFVFNNPSRRLGDYLAGTKLIKHSESFVEGRTNYLQILFALIIPIFIMIFIKILVYGEL